jgi:hypothetical protein
VFDRQAEWTEFERMEAIDTKNAALEKAAEEQRSAASTPEPSQDGDSDTQYVPFSNDTLAWWHILYR